MSGILGLVDPGGRLLDESRLTPMIEALRARGDRVERWQSGEVLLAVARSDWELNEGYAGTSLLVHDGELVVAADATLFYQSDLRERLRSCGVRPAGSTPGHLIAAAYRAWGEDCAIHLEGDFAFVLYDGSLRRVFGARDCLGRRGMYYAQLGEALIVASSVRAVVAHPECSRDYDAVALAEIMSYALTGKARTPYRAISALPAASRIGRNNTGAIRTGSYWQFPDGEESDHDSFDDAALKLRSLLDAAILERLAPTGPTTIWLSGGYDSSALYGVGNAATRQRGLQQLRPISFSYPRGDPGREDELIAEIVSFWKADTKWLLIDDVPLLRDAAERAARADVPFPHAFENWLRAALKASSAEGSHVAIYGDGGDQLFAVSTVFLRDLFAELRWRELLREWRAHGGSGVRALWRSIAYPVIDETLQRLRGGRRPEQAFPSWIRADFLRRHGLEEAQWEKERDLRTGARGRAVLETKRSLANPVVPRVAAAFSSLGLEHEVEMRAPLLDRRVLEFALRRPRPERASSGAVKHLLRRTADGLLPQSVLAPRQRKTGVLTGYFSRSFRADDGGVVTEAFANPILAELGIVDAGRIKQAWLDYRVDTSLTNPIGTLLLVAFQTETWLRSRVG